jgi:hypothetical protein
MRGGAIGPDADLLGSLEPLGRDLGDITVMMVNDDLPAGGETGVCSTTSGKRPARGLGRGSRRWVWPGGDPAGGWQAGGRLFAWQASTSKIESRPSCKFF